MNIIEKGDGYYKVQKDDGSVVTRYLLPKVESTPKTKTQEVNNSRWSRI